MVFNVGQPFAQQEQLCCSTGTTMLFNTPELPVQNTVSALVHFLDEFTVSNSPGIHLANARVH
jgi:hypothetical protein